MPILKLGSWNVLLDEYFAKFGDYSHVESHLREPGARLPLALKTIAELSVDVLALQEADLALKEALDATNNWYVFWTKKLRKDQNDGCILLVRKGLEITNFSQRPYSDGSGHVMQRLTVNDITVVNTHIKWCGASKRPHIGVLQVAELLMWMSDIKGPTVLLADGNYQPGELPRRMITAAGFTNAHGGAHTAFVNGKPMALDLVAARKIRITPIDMMAPDGIPNGNCPSDHVPVLARVHCR